MGDDGEVVPCRSVDGEGFIGRVVEELILQTSCVFVAGRVMDKQEG